MAFYAIEMAPVPGFGFVGGPEFSTNVQSIANGSESRNADWAICRHKYTAPYNNITDEAYAAIKAVFLLCRGRCHTFLFKDHGDYQATNERFGTGDGSTKTFQLSKTATLSGTSATYERTITKPVTGVKIYVDGVLTGAAIDTTTGQVTFAAAPAAGSVLTWTGEFRVHVRFDIDYLPFTINDKNRSTKFSGATIDLIEVLNENDSAT